MINTDSQYEQQDNGRLARWVGGEQEVCPSSFPALSLPESAGEHEHYPALYIFFVFEMNGG